MSLLHVYDSTVFRGYNPSLIINEINNAKVTTSNVTIVDGVELIPDADITDFVYPIYDSATNTTYIDHRGWANYDRHGELKVRNPMDKDFYVLLGKLEYCRYNENIDLLKNAMSFSDRVLSVFIADILSHHFNLSLSDTIAIKSLTAIYTIGLYYNDIDEISKLRYLKSLSSHHSINHEYLLNVSNAIGEWPNDLESLLVAIDTLDILKLKSLNTRTLITIMVQRSHSLHNIKHILSLGLEYPPAFAGLVMTIYNNQNLTKRTPLGQIIDKVSGKKKDHFKSFEYSINSLIRGQLPEDNA